MAKAEKLLFEIGPYEIPVKRYYERRRNVRIAVGKDAILFRLPSYVNDSDNKKHHEWASNWIHKLIVDKPHALQHLLPVNYETGDSILCMDQEYQIEIVACTGKHSKGNLDGETIILALHDDLNSVEKEKAARTLISRLMAQRFKSRIEERVTYINNKCFGHNVNAVRLKYNRSNWGSCSSSGNINLSTRLLQTPEWVRDYVIVHELAHMNHMNHSPKYWAVVEQVYPDYKKAEKWLKQHGAHCDFKPIKP